MALAHELDPDTKSDPKLSKESRGQGGEIIRDYEPVKGVEWRFGLPNYAKVNKEYFRGRTKVPAAGSLEEVVTKVVKNWEVESHHIEKPEQWKTMDVEVFKASLNGGPKIDAAKMAEIGPYNMLLGDIKGYKASEKTFEDANEIFSSTFPDGFAFECLEVYSGPPEVSFRWRHWGRFTGTFEDDKGDEYEGDGRLVEIFGLCIAKVKTKDGALVIDELQVFYDPNSMIAPLRTAAKAACCAWCGGGTTNGAIDEDDAESP